MVHTPLPYVSGERDNSNSRKSGRGRVCTENNQINGMQGITAERWQKKKVLESNTRRNIGRKQKPVTTDIYLVIQEGLNKRLSCACRTTRFTLVRAHGIKRVHCSRSCDDYSVEQYNMRRVEGTKSGWVREYNGKLLVRGS